MKVRTCPKCGKPFMIGITDNGFIQRADRTGKITGLIYLPGMVDYYCLNCGYADIKKENIDRVMSAINEELYYE